MEGVLFVWGIFFVVSGLFVCFNVDFSWVLLGFFFTQTIIVLFCNVFVVKRDICMHANM